MIATAAMWFSIGWVSCKELETGEEACTGPLPLWFVAAPMVVDIAAFYFIGVGGL